MSRRVDPVTDYARKVVRGKIVAGPHVRDSCARHVRDLEQGPKRGIFWDLDAAEHALGFFPSVLRLAGGQFEGNPFNLAPSQQFIVGSLFGWKRADGTRRFRRAYIEQGKGNGKSPMAAGIGLYCLLADGEARAEVYAAASKKDQALVMFRDAVAMWEQSPGLRKRLTPTGTKQINNLSDLRSGSFFRPISSDTGQSGPRPSCALCDEIHEHRDGNTLEMLERGFKFRRQPLLVMITNAGSDRGSVCWEEHQYAIKVARGDIENDTAFSYVCALDDDDDPLEDPRCWVKVNPLLGETITEGYLHDQVKQAKEIPGKTNNILRLHFCVWTDAERAWMTRAALKQVIVGEAEVEDAEAEALEFTAPLEGSDLFVGVDLAAVQDLLSIGFAVQTGEIDVERQKPDGSVARVKAPTFDAWIEAWSPGDTLAERAIRDSAPYDVWARRGWLNAPPGKIIHFGYPAARLADISTRFKVRLVAYDRYAFRRFEDELDALGVDLPLIEHPQGGKRRGAVPVEISARRRAIEEPQGLWMPGSVMELESLILENRIRLLGNPVLISACMAAIFEEDPFGNRWFSKRRATGRIDALVALAMAVGAATMGSVPKMDITDFLRNAVVA